MQYAADKFERTQPDSLKRIPFAIEEYESAPSLAEAIGWIILASTFLFVMLCFLGIA